MRGRALELVRQEWVSRAYNQKLGEGNGSFSKAGKIEMAGPGG